jgi:hypothetical protein
MTTTNIVRTMVQGYIELPSCKDSLKIGFKGNARSKHIMTSTTIDYKVSFRYPYPISFIVLVHVVG